MGVGKALAEKLSVLKMSRRNFVKSAAVAGGITALYGCSKDDKNDIIYSGGGSNLNSTTIVDPVDLSNEQIYCALCVHNCGTGVRCVSKMHVVNGRIVRVTSDSDDFDFDGKPRGIEAAADKTLNTIPYNDAKALTCPKGRAFKYRVHDNPAKLRYALKQTKRRGDLTGFIRIPVAQAMKEICTKYRATVQKYGAGAVLNAYGSSGGYGDAYAGYAKAQGAISAPLGVRGAYSDYSYFQYHYGQPLVGHPGCQYAYFSQANIGWQFPAIAGVVKNVVSWGSNVLTTVNSSAWSYIRSFEMLKKRGGKAWFIGPELSDTGVTCHTDWVQCRNYTDTALIMSMLYVMLINTFNTDGSMREKNTGDNFDENKAWLDVDYLDTMVYGFFASPEYWVNTTNGEIVLSDPNDAENYRHVEEVPAGKCLAAYIMGDDTRLANANYADAQNYTAQKFAGSSVSARAAACSYTIGGTTEANAAGATPTTEYQYKKDLFKAKTPAWAESICGVPQATIISLAKMYCNPAEHPICNEWAGGLQKQFNGSINIWAVTALMAITKTFGLSGETFGGAWATCNSRGPVADTDANHYIKAPTGFGNAGITPIGIPAPNTISCKEWFNCIKFAFKEYLTADNGYKYDQLPDWDGSAVNSNRYYSNDGGVKSTVKLKRDSDGNLVTKQVTVNGVSKTFYDWDTDESGNPVYAGIRMIISAGGGIAINQHMNSNDSAQTYRAIPALAKMDGGFNNPDGLCLVAFDIYFSPSARYMDYVLPGCSSLESAEYKAFGGQSIPFYRPAIVKPLGDALDGWHMAYEAYKAQSELGEFTLTDCGKSTTGIVGSHLAFTGTTDEEAGCKPIEDYYDKQVEEAIKDPSSKFYGRTKEWVYANQFTPAGNNDEYICTSKYETKGTTSANVMLGDSDTTPANRDNLSIVGKIRQNLDAYLSNANDLLNTPFVFTMTNGVQNTFAAATNFNENGAAFGSGGGATAADICPEDLPNRPQAAGRFQVYNGMVVFDYEQLFDMYHGYLAATPDEVGQLNKDREGDPKVYPIPMYFNFEDCFKEEYNGFSNIDVATGAAAAGPNARFFAQIGPNKPLTMSTTHDRFRVHSTHAENPLLRELNHRTAGGGWGSCNDWNEYCVTPKFQAEGVSAKYESPMISSAIYNHDSKTASWQEIWMNSDDASERGIQDGDLCRVENPIGSVRVIARVTDRCVKGHMNLHQGSWYDPNPSDGVDDGGCANTLIASYPSRMDHGNNQQFAYVTIKKEPNFQLSK